MNRRYISPDQPPLPLDPERFTKIVIKNGDKVRQTWMPDEETSVVLRGFLHSLYMRQIDMPHATGSIRGMSLYDNVRPHKDNWHFYCVDITDAFASVDQPTLHNIIVNLATDEAARSEFDQRLDDYIFVPDVPGLPLGLPTSPYLFNLYCRDLDIALGEFCHENDITYTRYLDDLTFSAIKPLTSAKRRTLRELVEQVPGFRINHGKSKLHERVTKPVTITGISLYPDGRVQPSPRLINRMLAVISEIEHKLDTNELIGDHELGVLNGWNSVLATTRDPDAPATNLYVELQKSYEATHARLIRALGYSTVAIEWRELVRNVSEGSDQPSGAHTWS